MSKSTVITLISNGPSDDKILNITGNIVHCIKLDDDYYSYEFPNKTTDDRWIVFMGDDAMGSLIGAYMLDGAIVWIANFGDDGNYEFTSDDEVYIIQPLD